MSREVQQPQETLVEEIVSYVEHQSGTVVATVAIGRWVVGRVISPDSNDPSKDYILPDYFEIDESHKREKFIIAEEDYQALISENPPWHQGKAGHAFERNDLWYAIDAKRQGVPLAAGSAAGAPHTPPGNPN